MIKCRVLRCIRNVKAQNIHTTDPTVLIKNYNFLKNYKFLYVQMNEIFFKIYFLKLLIQIKVKLKIKFQI